LRHETPELMAGISHGERLTALGHAIARKERDAFGCCELGRIETEMPREILVKPNETRRFNGNRLLPHEKSIRQARVAVVEREEIKSFGGDCHQISDMQLLR